ncbi:MAG: hypothetical protein GY947_01650 [Rhodobacteraceae bacterium]|nr:hypothetical protein [Paracoccaceae bacterium]
MAEFKAYVHLGAHRTGSSSFQLFLGHNRARLEQAGFQLHYPARDGAPGGYGRKLKLPPPNTGPRAQQQLFQTYVKPLRDRMAGQRTAERPKILLSEENILGRMLHFFGGSFYPGAEHRTKAVFNGFGHPVENVLLVIRNYADIFTSAYTMFAQIKQRPTFQELSQRLVHMETGWPELIDRILASGDIGRLTVVSYEHRGDNANLLRLLCPDVPDGLDPAPARQNISASTEAIAELQRRFTAGETLNIQARNQIIADLSPNNGGSKFAPFSARDKGLLTDRYLAEIDSLSKRSDITLAG